MILLVRPGTIVHRGISVRYILLALALCFAYSSACLADAGKSKAAHPYKPVVLPTADPCTADFSLKVVVSSTTGERTEPAGFELTYKSAESRGEASRMTASEQKTEFSRRLCEIWQSKNWPVLDRILYQSKQSERSKVECVNIAQVTYTVGGSAKHAEVCLGDAKNDSVAHAFRAFYEASEGMVR